MNSAMLNFKPPYSPSWVDRLINWIDRLPLPNWLFYVLLVVIEFVLYQLIAWWTHSVPAGQIETLYSYSILYNIFAIAIMDYMRRIAARTFDEFTPALGLSDEETAILKYRFTVLPPIPTLLVTLVGFAFTFVSLALPAADNGLSYGPAAIAAGVLGFAASGPFLFLFIRQLVMVNRIHRLAQRINLFQFSPLYAFSGLTVRVGLVGISLAYFNLASDPTVFNNPTLLIFNGGVLLLSLAAFIWPLYGMHQRLIQDKKRLIAENDQRFESVLNELNQHIDARRLDQVDALTKTMTSLVTQRDILNKIPTWPWRSGTFRGFATTLLLPIIIWLITRILTHAGL